MSSLRDGVTASAGHSIGSDSSLMRTPVAAAGATVFLREEGSTTFVPVYHQSSVTLRDLAEEFSISSVLECDAQGNVQPRAVAFDSPSDILHSGRHYIARRDARAETGNSYVTFKGKIFVKEYELEHPTPPASRPEKTVALADGSGNYGAPDAAQRRKPVATPYADWRRQPQEVLETHEAQFAAHSNVGEVRTPQRFVNEEEAPTISRALALLSDRKRPREDSAQPSGETSPTSSRKANDSSTATRFDEQEQAKKSGNMVFESPTKRGEGALHDRTNSSFASPASVSKIQPASPTKGRQAEEASSRPKVSSGPPLQQQSLRFIPFSETADDGSEMYVTLETLQLLCSEPSAQEEEFRQKHRAATDILESARRVLFLNDGNE